MDACVVVVILSVMLTGYVAECQPTTCGWRSDDSDPTDFCQLRSEIELLRRLIVDQGRRLQLLQSTVNQFFDQFVDNYWTKSHARKQQNISDVIQRNTFTENRPEGLPGLLTSIEIRDRWAYGVTKLRDSIYVLCYSPNSILVLEDRTPFRMRSFDIPQTRNPYSIAGCNESNALYVLDIGLKCIWKIAAVDDGVSLWLEDAGDAHSLSVTSDGRVLILRRNGTTESRVDVYAPDALLTDSVPLSRVVDPSHAVGTGSGTFIVSHRKTADDQESPWILSELDAEGRILRTSEEEEEEEEEDDEEEDDDGLDEAPVQLFVDLDDRIFVVDQSGGRVVVFNADLRWNLTVQDADDSKTLQPPPMRLFYDNAKLQLILIRGDSGGERLDVYEVQ